MAKCPVCNQLGRLTCAGCKAAVYCSKQHQVSHWSQHKTKCRPFQVEESQDLGRHLVASRDMGAGSQLISEMPLVLGPKTSTAPVCLGCYQSLDPDTSPRCPSCEWPACDTHCPGLTMQNHHLQECIILSLNLLPARIGTINYDIILPLRCLLLQRKSPKHWKQLLTMESHFKKRDEATEVFKEVEEKISKFLRENYLSHLDEGILQNTSAGIIHVLCGIIEVNALEIPTGDGEVMALYPNACLLEHSCLPNVKYSFNLADFKISVESAQEIHLGDHMCTMYTHALWGTAARSEHLARTKYFKCKCQRCLDPSELGTHLSTLKCIGSSVEDVTMPCGGLVLAKSANESSDWFCDRCPLVLSSSHVSDLISRLGAQVDSVMEEPSVEKLDKLLNNLEKLLHPNHYHCFTVAHSLVQLWGREAGYKHKQMPDQLLKRKIDVCRRLTCTTNTLDPRGVRTGLYTGVSLLEETCALIEVARRSNVPAVKERLLREGRDKLDKARAGLDDTGPAGQLRAVISSVHLTLLDQLNKFKIVELD